jgi:UDP-N-acetylglucosamine 1-carboxyvinyltransferase
MNSETVLKVTGCGGKKSLQGRVQINGAKNALLPALASSLLFAGDMKITNAPITEDTHRMKEVMEPLGVSFDISGEHEITLNSDGLRSGKLSKEVATKMRASVVLTGPLLARIGRVVFPQPGGCVIGARPIDQFIEGYQRLGARVVYTKDAYVMTAPPGGLRGADIFFKVQTVTGTSALMMTALLAKGVTRLSNCALEPEITSLAEYLVSCGAQIKGIGTTTLTITGGKLLKAKKPYVTIPDRIETGSFLLLGALTCKNLAIENCRPDHVEILTSYLQEAGVPIEIEKQTLRIVNNTKPNFSFKNFNVRTHEYPGFPTDLQPIVVAFLALVKGESNLFETIYEGRLKYTGDLIQMGASIQITSARELVVTGVKKLQGTTLMAHDIRAGFAVLMAALVASGQSTIHGVYFIDRGYEAIEKRLQALGARIERIQAK